jgi:hypothetical protein
VTDGDGNFSLLLDEVNITVNKHLSSAKVSACLCCQDSDIKQPSGLVKGLQSILKQPKIKANDDSALRIEVEAEGYAPFQSFPNEGLIFLHQLDTEQSRVAIPLEPECAVDGIVVDPAGFPVSGASVIWAWQVVKGLSEYGRRSDVMVTGDQGRFVWRGSALACRSLVVADHGDFGPGWVALDRPSERGNNPIVVRLKQKGTVRGRISDEAGNGIPYVRVALQPRDVPGRWYHLAMLMLPPLYGGLPPWMDDTADDGSFLLEGLPFGKYGIYLHHPEYVPSSKNDKEILIAGESHLEATMHSGRSVAVKVTSGEGDPIPGAEVSFFAFREMLAVGALGEDKFIRKWGPAENTVEDLGNGILRGRGLPSGPLIAQARATGYVDGKTRIPPEENSILIVLERKAPAGQEEEEEPCLELVASCEGLAVSIPFLRIGLYAPGTGKEVVNRTVEVLRGRGVARNLPAGTFNLLITSSDYEPLEAGAVAVPREAPLALELAPARPVWGKIAAPGPVRIVHLLDGEGRAIRESLVEGDNEFLIYGIGKEKYFVSASGPDGKRYTGKNPVAFSENEMTVVELMEKEPQSESE